MNENNFYNSTFATFKGCKKPKRNADYISYAKRDVYTEIFLDDIKDYITKIDELLNKCGNAYVKVVHLSKRGVEFISNTYGYNNRIEEDAILHFAPNNVCIESIFPISSKYWYGENSKGKYVIRESDHWSNYRTFDQRLKKGCGSVASCFWPLKSNKFSTCNCGKAYFKDFKENKQTIKC